MNKMSTALLIMRTVKYLTIRQVIYRVIYKFKKYEIKSSNYINEKLNNLKIKKIVLKSPLISEDAADYENNIVKFLNHETSLNRENLWNDNSLSKLWLYNLHYMNEFNSKNSINNFNHQSNFLRRWISENPIAQGNGWEPYPLSLRIVNIIKWVWRNEENCDWVHPSLYQQVVILNQKIEYHILGNHLFANGKALIFAGIYFNQIGEKFLDTGINIIENQVKEQFLEDGGHFELSPMYHSIMIWDILEIIDLAKSSNCNRLLPHVKQWNLVVKRGISWLNSMLHQDNEISFFNDSAIGIAPKPEELFQYAVDLGVIQSYPLKKEGLTVRANSGYSVYETSQFKLLMNHAQIKPKYQPGHAHADTFSFELSISGERFLVNGGVSQYGTSIQREMERGSSSHNTLVFNDEDSSEVWHGFRVARRANVFDESFEETSNGFQFSAKHDGYCRFRKSLIHCRTWTLSIFKTKVELNISDEIPFDCKEKVKCYYHLHPNVKVVKNINGKIKLLLTNQYYVTLDFGEHIVNLEDYNYHPEFGLSIPSKRIVLIANDPTKKISCNIIWDM